MYNTVVQYNVIRLTHDKQFMESFGIFFIFPKISKVIPFIIAENYLILKITMHTQKSTFLNIFSSAYFISHYKYLLKTFKKCLPFEI